MYRSKKITKRIYRALTTTLILMVVFIAAPRLAQSGDSLDACRMVLENVLDGLENTTDLTGY